MSASRPFAIVTGASTGIGFELAKRCAKEGYDLLIAADEPEIEKAATTLRSEGTEVEALQADLATIEGVDQLYAAAKGRQVDALLANAGRGLGHAFLDQDFGKARLTFALPQKEVKRLPDIQSCSLASWPNAPWLRRT